MSKYSKELKLEVVNYYLKGHSYSDCVKKFGVISSSNVGKWVRKYREHGIEGLFKNQKTSYDGNFKQFVVEFMHDNKLSANQTAVIFKLAGSDRVSKWERVYYEEGPQGLYIDRRGRPGKMTTKRNKNTKNIDNNEDLLAEVQRLRMENEYLKKLNALVQERIKHENKKK